MKKLIISILALSALSLSAQNQEADALEQAAEQDQVAEQDQAADTNNDQNKDSESFEKAAEEAEEKLEAALDELDEIQSDINDKKPELAARLDDVESKALRLRDQASNAQRVQQGYDVEVSQLEKEKESVIDNNNYLKSTLMNEYIRRFESTMDPSEIPLYNKQILDTLAYTEGEEDADDATIFEEQVKTLKMALERGQSVVGGRTFSGSGVVDGKLTEGSFALIGPASYFASEGEGEDLVGGITVGMRNNHADIYSLPEHADSIAEVTNTGEGTIPVDTTGGEALEGITHEITLLEEFEAGGVVMYPILSLFALAILIALFKTIELFRVKGADNRDIEIILDHLKNNKNDAALSHAKSVGGPVGTMLCTAVENASEDREVIEEALYEDIIKTQPKLERFLAFIAVVAATAPLMGLLGTVTGMIKTFKLITIVGTGDAKSLSSGISEALITTKWGLTVAIPTLFIHALLNRKAKGVISSMEQAAVSFINGVSEMRGHSESEDSPKS